MFSTFEIIGSHIFLKKLIDKLFAVRLYFPLFPHFWGLKSILLFLNLGLSFIGLYFFHL
jgi:hypothetical protein